MTGRHEIGSDLFAIRPQLAELEPDVAHHTRVRCAAGEVFLSEIILDSLEISLEIKSVKWDIQAIRDVLSIDGIRGAATGFGPAFGIFAVRTGPHEDTDDLMAFRLEQRGGNRAVDSTTHREYNPTSHSHAPSCRFLYLLFTAGTSTRGIELNRASMSAIS